MFEIGAHAFGNACFIITFDLDSPLSSAISIYGDDNKFIIAARVILIICATVTKVRVKAGRIERYTRSRNGVEDVTLDSDGKN